MTCDRATELLPWLANETLDPGERREVLAHLGACAACRRALADARFALATADAHLPAAVLVAVAFGDPLPGPQAGIDAALIDEHLAACPQCAADLELARTSRALADDGVALFPRQAPAPSPTRRRAAGWMAAALAAGLVAAVTTTGWLTARREIERIAAAGAPAPAVAPPPRRPAAGTQAPPAAATAEEVRRLRAEADRHAAAERAAQEQLAALRQELARAGAAAPQVNTQVADLYAPGSDVLRGEAGQVRTFRLPPGTGGLTLILHPAGDAPSRFREHAFELRDAAGKRWLGARGLVQHPEDLAFTLNLPRLPPGAYTLDLYGLDGERRERVVGYEFRIE